MKKLRRVLAVVLTLAMIFSLFSESLSAIYYDVIETGAVGLGEAVPEENAGEPEDEALPNIDEGEILSGGGYAEPLTSNELGFGAADPADLTPLDPASTALDVANDSYKTDYTLSFSVTCSDGRHDSGTFNDLPYEIGSCDMLTVNFNWPKGLLPNGEELEDFEIDLKGIIPNIETGTVVARLSWEGHAGDAGMVTYEDGKLKVHFNDDFKNPEVSDREMSANVTFNFPGPGQSWEADHNYEVQIGEKQYDFTWDSSKPDASATKSSNDVEWDEIKGTFVVHNTVTVNVKGGVGNQLHIEDIIDPAGALTLDTDSIKVTASNEKNYTLKSENGGFTVDFGEETFKDGDTVTITYDTVMNKEYIDDFLKGRWNEPEAFNNKLKYSYNDETKQDINVKVDAQNNFFIGVTKDGNGVFHKDASGNIEMQDGQPLVDLTYTVTLDLQNLLNELPDQVNGKSKSELTASEILSQFGLWDDLTDTLTLPNGEKVDLTKELKEALENVKMGSDSKFTATYTTTQPGGGTFGNTVSVGSDSGTDNDLKVGEVGVAKSLDESEGSGTDFANGVYVWNVEVTLPEYKPDKVEFTETPTQVDGYNHTIENVKIQRYENGAWVDVNPADIGVTVTTSADKKTYTAKFDTDNAHYPGGETLRFVVTTKYTNADGTLPKPDTDTYTVKNKAAIGIDGQLTQSESQKSFSPEPQQNIVQKGVDYNSGSGIVTWKVFIGAQLISKTGSDVTVADKYNVELSDSLPEGLTYVPGSVRVIMASSFDNKLEYNNPGTVEVAKKISDILTRALAVDDSNPRNVKFTLKVTEAIKNELLECIKTYTDSGSSWIYDSHTKIMVYYDTKVDPTVEAVKSMIQGNGDGAGVNFTNRASVKFNGEAAGNDEENVQVQGVKSLDKVFVNGYLKADASNVNSFANVITGSKYQDLDFFSPNNFLGDDYNLGYADNYGRNGDFQNFLFVIDVNPYGLKFAPDSVDGNIIIEDNMGEDFTIVGESIRLIEVADDDGGNYRQIAVHDINDTEHIKSVDYNSNTETTTITVSDGRHYVLVYFARFKLKDEDFDKNASEIDAHVKNDVNMKFSGGKIDSGVETDSGLFSVSGKVSAGLRFRVNVNKYVVVGGKRTNLAGAEFELYEVTKVNTEVAADDFKDVFTTVPVEDGKGTTNSLGQLMIPALGSLNPGKIYCLKETKAPGNFTKIDDIYFYYFGLKDYDPEDGESKDAQRNLYDWLLNKFDFDDNVSPSNDKHNYEVRMFKDATNDIALEDKIAKGSLEFTKEVKKDNGISAPDDVSFRFTVLLENSDYKDTVVKYTISGEAGVKEAKIGTGLEVTLKDGQTAKFTDIPVGTTYTVSEVRGADNRFKYDDYIFTGTIANKTGKLEVKHTFTNEFTPKQIDVTPEIYKKFVGYSGEKCSFTVDLTANPEDGASYTPGSNAISANGKINLGTVKFTKPGTYILTVRESSGSDENTVYDDSEITITYVVEQDETSKNLVIKEGYPTYTKNSVTSTDVASFINKKKAEDSVEVGKTFTFDTGTPANDEYVFTFTAAGDSANDGAEIDNDTVTATFTKGSDGSYTVKYAPANAFKFKFSKPGTYTYTITEVPNSVENVVYDNTVYTVTFVVTDDDTKGLTVEKTITDGNNATAESAAFANKYNEDKKPDEFLELDVTKIFTGTWPEGAEFTFELTSDDENPVLPNKTTVTVNSTTKKGKFGRIVYDENTLKDALEKSGQSFDDNFNVTFNYQVKEIPGDLKQVVYDTTVYDVTVKLVYNKQANNLSKTVTVNGETYTKDSLTFTNKLYDTVKVDFEAKKKVEGNYTFKEGEFEFTLTPLDGAPMPEGKKTLTAKNGAPNGENIASVVFSDITYDRPGTYYYTITEPKPSAANNQITYSTATFWVKVTVTADGSSLKADVEYYSTDPRIASSVSSSKSLTPVFMTASTNELNETAKPIDSNKVVFVNTYTAGSTEITLTAKKTVTGDKYTIKDGEFEFVLSESDKNGKVLNFMSRANNNGESVTFETIEYKSAGTYYYLITETKGSINGMSYDGSRYLVKVEVTDNGGKLEASATYTKNGEPIDAVIFTNTYKAAQTNVTFKAEKQFSEGSDDHTKSGFTFELRNAKGEIVDSQITGESGKVTFTELTFDKVGTYNFTITEKADGEAGMTYDTTVHNIVVEVTDDGSGKLKKKITISDGKNAPTVIEDGEIPEVSVTFTNTYHSPETSVEFRIKKVLSGDWSKVEARTFTFELTEEGNEDFKRTAKVTVDEGKTDATETFGEIPYDSEGTHTYLIHEVGTDGNGITYDHDIKTVTVEVKYDYNSKKYVAECDPTDLTFTFTNTYKAAQTDVTFKAEKKFTEDSDDHTKSGFTFELRNAKGEIVDSQITGESGKVTFTELTFDKVGTYHFTIVEEKGTNSGMTYDDTVYNAVVVITDDGEGHLQKQVTINDVATESVTFTNTYKAAPTDVIFTAEKQFSEGSDAHTKAGFTFILTQNAEDETIVLKAAESHVTDATGRVSFTKLTFDKVGTYHFTIIEEKGTNTGMTYDTTVYNIVVEVTDDGEGHLQKTVTINGVETESVTFTNTYDAPTTSIDIKIAKKLSGREWKENEKFEFTIYSVSGETETELGKVSVGKDETVTIYTANYDNAELKLADGESKEFLYRIRETKIDGNGITYAGDVDVTVTVTRKGETLTAAKSTGDKTITFTNTYKAAPTSVEFMAEKQFSEESDDHTKAGFTFTLTQNADDEIKVLKAAESHVTDAAGKVTFTKLTFDKAGTYNFTIVEEKGTNSGMTYDTTVYNAVVIVTDDGEGHLQKQVTINGVATESVTFTNTYDAPKASIDIKIAKKLEGREWKENETFEFAIYSVTKTGDNEVEKPINIVELSEAEKDGKLIYTANYDNAELKLADGESKEFLYRIRETSVSGNGITYAGDVDVTVTVTREGETLTAVKNTDGEVITFTNTYTTNSVSTHFEAKKSMAADSDKTEVEAGKYEFTLTDSTGKVVATVRNGADGSVKFPEITYNKDDAGEHVYTITETNLNEPRYVYDESVYTVKVTVTDDGNGTLTVSDPEYLDEEGNALKDIPEFVNRYNYATGVFSLRGKKVVTGDANGKTKDVEYKFDIYRQGEETPFKTVTAKGNSTITFFDNEEFNETQIGEHIYIIKEKALSSYEGIIDFDETEYTVTVSVKLSDSDYQKLDITYTVNPENEGGIVFTNVYNKPADKPYTFTASKTVNGRPAKWYSGDVFEFKFEALGDSPSPRDEKTFTVKNTERDVSFGSVIFTENDVGKSYSYRISEVIPENEADRVPGVTYDDTVYNITVNVKLDENRKIVLEVETKTADGTPADSAAFVNSYDFKKTPVEISLDVNKEIIGADKDAEPGFTYKFTVEHELAEGEEIIRSGAETVGAGKAQVLNVRYTAKGTYVYLIKETKGSDIGVTYDETYYRVIVTVTEHIADTGDISYTAETAVTHISGTESEAVEADEITFRNSYRKPVETPVSLTMAGRKTVEGDAPVGTYTFRVTKDSETPRDITAGAGEVTFFSDVYSEEGTHTYRIEEIPGNVPGMTYDSTYYIVTVNVTLNTDEITGDKTYSETHTVKHYSADGSEIAGDTPEFVNKFETGGFNVSKTVSGTKGVEERDSIDFGFEVTLTVKGAPYVGSFRVNGTETSSADGVYRFRLKHGETVRFTDIPVGVHYKAVETDTNGYASSVTGAEGDILSGETEIRTAAFTNTKDKDTVGLSVTKFVSGTDAEYDRVFHFTVTLSDNTINGVYGEMTFENGVARFGLTSGTTVSATGLPADIGYTVTEDEANLEGYITTSENASSVSIPEGSSASAVFYNHRDKKLGSLTVTKTVTGDGADVTRRFGFAVYLNDTSINGVYGQMTFIGGAAQFTLAHGQSITASGLPVGTAYTVYETDSGDYQMTSYGTVGVITENIVAQASFVNHKDKEEKFGGLSVTKTVIGEGADHDLEFVFTVTLSDSEINGEYGDMTFVNGVAKVILKDGETAVADGLPEGITYTVTEEEVENYFSSGVGTSGTIEADETANAEFVNTYEAPKLGNLSVTKTVTGTAGDQTKLFGFMITLSDANINGIYGDMNFVNGFATVYLSSGMTAVATGLPEGVGYTVTELDSEDYIVSSTGAFGNIIADVTANASFINHKDQPEQPEQPETPDNPHGDDMNAGVGRDRPHGDDMNAGVGMDDMNPGTGDFEAESFANGAASIIILWTVVFLFGAVVIARKKREEK